MATLFIRHRVADYAAWRTVYDSVGPMQKRLGVRAESVNRSADDPNEITVTHEFDSVEAAKAFAGSAELREAMASAGVQGQPTMWFTTRA